MKLYKLSFSQFLPINKVEAWDFFSSPRNLSLITPPRMNFRILSVAGGEQIHRGQIIKYRVSVLPFVRVNWITEITEVVPFETFTDIQTHGPYKWWNHRHTFKPVEDGIQMIDELEYALHFGMIGNLANALIVGREIKMIFDFRFHALQKRFGAMPQADPSAMPGK